MGYGYSSPAVVALGEVWSVLVGHYECPPVERSFLCGAVIANAIDCNRSVTHVAANCESVELFVMFMAIFSLREEAFQRLAVGYGYPHLVVLSRHYYGGHQGQFSSNQHCTSFTYTGLFFRARKAICLDVAVANNFGVVQRASAIGLGFIGDVFNCRNPREAPRDLAVHVGCFGWLVNFFRYYAVNGT